MAKQSKRLAVAAQPLGGGGTARLAFRVSPLLALGLILGLFVVLIALLPLGAAVKIGADEDFELSKATLLSKGYHLYTEIWDDQPPLDTFLVLGILKHVSPLVWAPRLFSVLNSAILLSSVFVIGWRMFGTLAGFVAAFCLMVSPGYIELSASCMQEIPALAPAVAALAILAAGRRTPWFRTELLAGAVFGVALQMKLIGTMYLPVALLVVWLREYEAILGTGEIQAGAGGRGPAKSNRESGGFWNRFLKAAFGRRPILAALAFGLVSAAVFVALNAATGSPLRLQLRQGWEAHFTPAQSFVYGAPIDHPFDWSVLWKHWDSTIPAMVGLAVCGWSFRRHPLVMLAPAWLLLTLVVFSTHVPWWSYYYVHNAVPIGFCAAIGVAAIVEQLVAGSKRAKTAAACVAGIAALAWMGGRVYLQVDSIRQSPRLHSALVLKEILRYKPYTEFLFADEPIYSYYSGMPMPPRLAMISLKRLWSGDMSPAKLALEMEKAKPGLVLLGNDTRELPFQDLLDTEYRMCYQDAKYRLFVLRSIASKAQY